MSTLFIIFRIHSYKTEENIRKFLSHILLAVPEKKLEIRVTYTALNSQMLTLILFSERLGKQE